MKIGFDISQTGMNKAGCGYFADALIQALSEIDKKNQYILYPNFGNHYWDPQSKFNTRKIHRHNFSNRNFIGTHFTEAKNLWESFPRQLDDRLGNPDIIHSNNFFTPRHLNKPRLIYTLYDLSFLDHPEFSIDHNTWGCFYGMYDAALYADFIISISKYSRDRFLDIFPHFPDERIKVVYPGNRFNIPKKSRIKPKAVNNLSPDKFWLASGTLEPRKNTKRLLKAYANYSGKNKLPYPLVLAGAIGWLDYDIWDLVEKLGLTNKVIILGYVSDANLLWLYKHCYAFIYPSLYEGFGLPVLEAMSAGAAVITSNTTSIPEVAGNAADIINPKSQKDMADAFRRLNDDDAYRKELKRRSIKQAKYFSWEKTSLEIMDLYEHVHALPKKRSYKPKSNYRFFWKK